MDSKMITIVREDKSVISVPKTVVLNYLSKASRDSDVIKTMTLEEYHLCSDFALKDYDIICEQRKFAASYAKVYLVYFDSFEPKNVPIHIQKKYDKYVRKHPDVCMEYYLMYYYEKTDFTVEEESMQKDTSGVETNENFQNILTRGGSPMAIVVPLPITPIVAEMDNLILSNPTQDETQNRQPNIIDNQWFPFTALINECANLLCYVTNFSF